MKIGLDFHGVIDKYPEHFRALAKAMLNAGHEVHLITGHSIDEDFVFRLRELMYGVLFTALYSVTDDLERRSFPFTINEKGGKMFDKELWEMAKADYCKRNKIDLMFDDSDVYSQYFTTPYMQVK